MWIGLIDCFLFCGWLLLWAARCTRCRCAYSGPTWPSTGLLMSITSWNLRLSASIAASVKRQKLKMSRSNLLIAHLFALFCRLSTLAPWVGFSRGSSRRWMKTHATPHPPPSPLPAQAGTQRGRAATRTPWIPIPATRAPRQQTTTVSMLPASAAHLLWPYVSLKYTFLNCKFFICIHVNRRWLNMKAAVSLWINSQKQCQTRISTPFNFMPWSCKMANPIMQHLLTLQPHHP